VCITRMRNRNVRDSDNANLIEPFQGSAGLSRCSRFDNVGYPTVRSSSSSSG
jgi:hypothetical protein